MGASLTFKGEFTITPPLHVADDMTFFNTYVGKRFERRAPSKFCNWKIDGTSTALIWDGAEKFREYELWLRYLIEHFFGPRGYKLEGLVEWASDCGEVGVVGIKNNVIRVREYKPPTLDELFFDHGRSFTPIE